MSLLSRAIAWAERAHAGQFRLDGITPFLSHPMATASLVVRFGGTEEQIAAALLHDTPGLGEISLQDIEGEFGPAVAALVGAFTDPELSPELPPELMEKHRWELTKKAYLSKLQQVPPEALLVVGCEELHELTELAAELRTAPPAEVWRRRPSHAMNHAWYGKEILKLISSRLTSPSPARLLVQDFALELRRLQDRVFEGG